MNGNRARNKSVIIVTRKKKNLNAKLIFLLKSSAEVGENRKIIMLK